MVDTIGAGDAFVAGFLTWWTAHALLQHDAADPDALESAATAAIGVAAADCTMRGADLPVGLPVVDPTRGCAQSHARLNECDSGGRRPILVTIHHPAPVTQRTRHLSMSAAEHAYASPRAG